MPGPPGEAVATEPRRRHPRATALGLTAVLAVVYAGLCKGLLFHDLEYVGSDLFSFLEMSWSWYYAGLWLHDNIYGYHYALHNFNLVPAFSVLTIPFGAYGFVLGLVLLNALAVWRVASIGVLDLSGRLAVLAGLLSPTAYFAFDNPYWGFHPELCYPPLAVLLATELANGGRWRAIVAAVPVVLVKEDGAVLCASVLLAHFASRLWALRHGPRIERRRVLVVAFQSLLAVTLVFAAGMTALSVASRAFEATQSSSNPRVLDSLRILALTVTGHGRPFRRLLLREGLTLYALMAGLLLVPLARRLPRGLLLLLLSSPPLLIVLLVSSATYLFSYMLWSPRVATLLGLVLACLVFASAGAGPASLDQGRARLQTVVVCALIVLSWATQLPFLKHLSYLPWSRLNAPELFRGKRYAIAELPKREVRFLRCLAARLPGGLPLSAPEPVRPFFHRQSIVLDEFASHAWHPARFRVVPSAAKDPAPPETPCSGPRVGGLAVQAECELVPLVAGCAAEEAAARDSTGSIRYANARAISSNRAALAWTCSAASATSAPRKAGRGSQLGPGSRRSAASASTAKVHCPL